MKIVYIGISVSVVYMLRYKEPWRTSYDSVRDNFPHWKYLAAPCAVAALLINDAYLKYGVYEFVREVRPRHPLPQSPVPTRKYDQS